MNRFIFVITSQHKSFGPKNGMNGYESHVNKFNFLPVKFVKLHAPFFMLKLDFYEFILHYTFLIFHAKKIYQ